MKFRSLTYTLLSMMTVSAMAVGGAMAQTPVAQGPAAPPPPPSAQVTPATPAGTAPAAPPAVQPGRPAVVGTTQPSQLRPSLPPPPPPGDADELPIPQQPIPASVLSAPGIEAVLPTKIDVSGVAAAVNGQPISYELLVTKFLGAGAPTFLDELINEQLIRQEAKKQGVVVTPKEVDEKLLEAKNYLLPQYPGKSWGEFLALQGRSESYIRDNIYDGLLAVKLVEKTPQFQTLAGKVHLYHILKLTTAVQGSGTPVSETTAKEEIENIRALIISGKATFQDEARKESQDSSAAKGGDLGWVGKGEGLDPAFSAAAFALKEGEISEPVKSQYGYHLILAAKLGEHASKAEIADYLSGPDQEAAARKQIQPYLKDLRAKSKIVEYVLQKPVPIKSPITAPLTIHPTMHFTPTPGAMPTPGVKPAPTVKPTP